MQECKFFARGNCLRGNQCSFAHVVPKVEAWQPQPMFYPQENYPNGNNYENENYSLPLCKFFLQGGCAYGNNCRYSHQIPNLNHQQRNQPNTQELRSQVEEERPKKKSQLSQILEKEKEMEKKSKVNQSHFELLTIIGDGLMGKVFQVRMKETDKIYAMKVIPKKRVLEDQVITATQTERNILMGIDHPFITKLHFSFQTNDRLYLIMDYLPGGDLSFHLNNMFKFSEDFARFYAAEVVLALEHLHKENIIYRDLKASNTLLDSTGHIKLADFGMAKHLDEVQERKSNSYCGTTRYMAPEILKNSPYGTAVDWWSFGVLLFQMLTGEFPFDADDLDEIPDRIIKDVLYIPPDLSPHAQSLLKGLLNRNPNKRFKVQQIKTHPFFKSIDWKNLHKQTPPFQPYIENGMLDVNNFPSEITCQTPEDTLEPDEMVDVVFALEQFTYVSPSVGGILSSKFRHEFDHSSNTNTDISESEDEASVEFEIPEDACFGISL